MAHRQADATLVPLRALILEARPDDTDLIVRELRRGGFDPEWCRVGTEAEYLQHLRPDPDIILADHTLLRLDAARALTLMRDRGLDIPIIVVSEPIGDEAAVSLLHLGAADYLLKNQLERLGPAVRRALERARLRREKERMIQRLRALIEHSHDAGMLVDEQGTVLYASPSIRRVLGHAPDALAGRSVFAEIYPNEVDHARSEFEALRSLPGRRGMCTTLFRRNDGAWRWMEVVLANLLEDPDVGAIVLSYRDVTQGEETAQALRDSEGRYRGLFEGVPVGLYRTTPDGTILDANPAFLEMLAYPDLETFKKVNAASLYVDPAVREQWTEALEHRGVVTDAENALRRRDGTTLWVRARGRIVRDATGRVLYQEGAIIDVTARKQAEEALREREQRFRVLIENSFDAIVLVGADRRIRYASPSIHRVLGYESDELIGRGRLDFCPPEDVDGLRRRFDELRRHPGGSVITEGRMRHRDGSWRWVETVSTNLLHDAGVQAVVVNLRDVSDRKRAEDAHRQLAAIVESSDDAIFRTVLDGSAADGTALTWNRGAERIYGYAAEEMIGQPVARLVPPNRAHEIPLILARVRRGEPITNFETIRMRRDGSRIHVSISFSPIKDASGAVVGASTIARDITERKLAEAELRRQAAHLEALNAIISSAVSASDLSALFESTIDLTLRALGCDKGGIWAGSARVLRGMPVEVGESMRHAAESSGRELRGPVAVRDWLARPAPGAETLAPIMIQFDVRASLTAPIQVGRRVIGGVSALSSSPRSWSPEEVLLVEAIGKQIGEAVERLQLFEAAQRRTAELEAFYDLSRRLRQARGMEEMYPIIVDHARGLLAADQGALALAAPDRDTFTCAYTVGIELERPGLVFPVEGTRSGQVLKTGVAFVTQAFSKEAPNRGPGYPPYHAAGPLIVVPLRSEEEIIGTLRLARWEHPDVRPFADAEVRLLEGIAEVAGTAIGRARLRERLEQSYIEMVLALARAVDARDRYTADHSERIATRAVAVARVLGCPEAEVQDIHWAAALHDIGKLGVPDDILRKAGPLTDAEWDVMRQHPIVGEQILWPVERMRRVAALVRHHQERWDGTGYPDHLQGQEIPLGARILAVADAYSAITDDRAYDKGRSAGDAVEEIRRCSGTQFDPHIVDVFCRVLASDETGADSSRPVARPPAGALAPAIIRPFAQTRQFQQAVPAMADVAKRLLRPLDLTAVLDEILGQIQDVFGYPICGVLFLDERSQELEVKAQRGYDPEVAKRLRLKVGAQGIAGWVASQRRSYYAPDVARDALYVAGSPRARSNVAYPLIVDDRVIGVLDVESPLVDAFPQDVRTLLEAFAVLAALAILRAQRDDDLNRLALTDGLTGLINHRALWQTLEREVARAKRSGEAVSLILVEVDMFKQINDRFGHMQGDAVLRQVADVLRRNSRAMDLVARFGGDEFVLLLPTVAKSRAVQVAERVRRHVERIIVPGGARLTVSVGLAGAPPDGETARLLMEAADGAMYRAKHAGGNRVCVA